MNQPEPDQYNGSSYDETLFLGYQKFPKVKLTSFESKNDDLY